MANILDSILQAFGMQSGGDSVSVQTKSALAKDPDLDKGLYPAATPLVTPPPATSTIAKDPTQQVTQQQYNDMLAKQKAEADAAYLRYKSGVK